MSERRAYTPRRGLRRVEAAEEASLLAFKKANTSSDCKWHATDYAIVPDSIHVEFPQLVKVGRA